MTGVATDCEDAVEAEHRLLETLTMRGQHIVHHLAPKGIAGVVLANGSMSSNTSGEGEIRQTIEMI